MVQVTSYVRKSEEFQGILLQIPVKAAQPTAYCLHPIHGMSMLCPWNVHAVSVEHLCSVRGASVLRLRNIDVLYTAYLGSNLWTL